MAQALNEEVNAAAGIDVLEKELLLGEHPLRKAKNTLLTSHIAWYTEGSISKLQKMAAEEVLRGLTDQPVKNMVKI